MSESKLDWLNRVSGEDADVNITPGGVGLGEDQATDVVGGTEQSNAQGTDSDKSHKVGVKEDLTPDEGAGVVGTDGEVSVHVSKEDGDLNFDIDLTTGKPSNEDATNEEEEEEDTPPATEPADNGQTPGAEPAADADAGQTEPPAGDEPPPAEDGADAPAPTEDDNGAEPPAAEETDAGTEPPVTDAPPGEETPAGDDAPGATDPVEAAPGEDAPASTGVDGEVPVVEEEPGKVTIAIDPVTEIKEGLDTAVEQALEDGQSVSPEDFDGEDGVAAQAYDESLDDVTDLSNMQVTVESYLDLVDEAQANNRPVDALLARSIQIGLGSFRGENLTEGQPSCEDFNDPAGRYQVSLELADDLRGKAQAISQALLAAIKDLLRHAGDAVAELLIGHPEVVKTNERLLDRLSGLRKPATGMIPVGNASRLFIGDNFGGDAPANYRALQTFADTFMLNYPKFWRGMTDRLLREFNQGDGTVDLAALSRVFADGFNPQQFGLKGSDGKYVSAVMLGNRQMVVTEAQAAEKNGVSALSGVVSASLETLTPSGSPSSEVKLPDPQTLKQILVVLDKLLSQIPNYVKEARDLAASGHVTKALTDPQVIGALGEHGAAGLVASMTKPSGRVVGYLINTTKVAHRFIEHCIALHEKESA